MPPSLILVEETCAQLLVLVGLDTWESYTPRTFFCFFQVGPGWMLQAVLVIITRLFESCPENFRLDKLSRRQANTVFIHESRLYPYASPLPQSRWMCFAGYLAFVARDTPCQVLDLTVPVFSPTAGLFGLPCQLGSLSREDQSESSVHDRLGVVGGPCQARRVEQRNVPRMVHGNGPSLSNSNQRRSC